MHPEVNTIILVACFATFLYPIIPLIKYNAQIRKEQKEMWADLNEEIRKLKADPQNYKVKR